MYLAVLTICTVTNVQVTQDHPNPHQCNSMYTTACMQIIHILNCLLFPTAMHMALCQKYDKYVIEGMKVIYAK